MAYVTNSKTKWVKHPIILTLAVFMISSLLTSCDKGESSQFAGTWSRQVQWADTNGSREDTYVLKSDGTGTYKWWDWPNQKYLTTTVTWVSSGNYIVISRKSVSNYTLTDVDGFINSGGTALYIADQWYYKQ